ncbi:MAG: radical SAM protein [Lachnospira sp.]|nr:radical SAM protein [Lachnospira sp.]
MKSLNNDYYNPLFSHIYVEKDVLDHPRTQEILRHFPNAVVIEIIHYKDVFCRRGQQYLLQHNSQNLIIAQKEDNFLYEGAPVCQSFGNSWFYYTSCMMNCVYNCEYCYLKGMYPSGNMVAFVNLEDTFTEVENRLKEHELYICVSYDTDLLAVENIFGYTAEWAEFVKKHDNLKIEVRTKSANKRFFEEHEPSSGMITAFTLSPQYVIDAYEHKTPTLKARLSCIKLAIDKGFQVRLAFDPMIYCKDWRKQYSDMLKEVFESIDMQRVIDVSVGSFRISQDYLKNMRRSEPYSAVVQFPYENEKGVYQYPKRIMQEMEHFLVGELSRAIPAEKIFLWKE